MNTSAPKNFEKKSNTSLRTLRMLSYLVPCAVLGLALSTSWLLWQKEKTEIERVLQGEFDVRVSQAVSLFHERMLAYEQTLRATQGLFSASQSVQRDAFQSFVSHLRIQNAPGLQGIGFAMIVPSVDREKHIAIVRSQGLPNYTVQPPGSHIASNASTSALYFEPAGSTFLSTLGTDYFAEPSRRPAMEHARDTAGIAVSNKVKLPDEDADQIQAGYRMVLPVYKHGMPQATLDERHANITGWIYVAFSMNDLMNSILGERTDITVDVHDGGDAQGNDLLFDTYSDRVGGESALKLFNASRQVEVGGYAWTITAHSLPNFTSAFAIGNLQLVAQLGAIASVMLALLAWLLLRMRMRSVRVAEKLRTAKEEAEAASQAKSQFLAVASHDLRQPLQALDLFVATLQSMASKPQLSGAEVTRIASHLQAALNGLGSLLDGLFDLSRLDSGTVAVARQPIDVAPMLAEINNIFAGPAQAKGLRFKVVLPHGLWVDSDPQVLQRILSNLVTNALRYTAHGGILIGCRPRGKQLEFQVLDTGIGIADHESAKIFGEFYQVGGVARDRERGLGLGLAIVLRSVQLLGGQVRVQSALGKGSVFSVMLPRADALPRLEKTADNLQVNATQGNVLVIDDDPEVRESMRHLLTEWGHKVLVADSLEAALDIAKKHGETITLILSDYQLGVGVTGVDVIHAIRQLLGREIAAKLITGDTSADTQADAARHGLKFLHKPIDPQVLKALMKT